MPETCACYGCNNRRTKKGGRSFHRFPLKNEQLLAKWLANVNRADFTPSTHSLVCSDHFRAKDYMNGVHPRERGPDDYISCLLPKAVPTIFPAHRSQALKELTSRLQASLQPRVETQLKRGLLDVAEESCNEEQTTKEPHINESSRPSIETRLKRSLLHEGDGSCNGEQTAKKPHIDHSLRTRSEVSLKQSLLNKTDERCNGGKTTKILHIDHPYSSLKQSLLHKTDERCNGGKTTKISHIDHPYTLSEGEPEESLHNVHVQTQLNGAKKKLRRSKVLIRTDDESISQVLKLVTDNNLITKCQLDLLHTQFGESSFLCFEKEVKNSASYSDELKKFAITLHFYSAQAYKFLRECLPLPHPSTIGQWSESISLLLKLVADNNLITKCQLDLLYAHFGEKSFLCFEKEVRNHNGDSASYSDELKKFAITLHFYSAQAYSFVREFLPLPHPSTIGQWNASTESYPGFLEEVMNRMQELVSKEMNMSNSTPLLDAMAIELTNKMSFS